jgi:hypothetical protein
MHQMPEGGVHCAVLSKHHTGGEYSTNRHSGDDDDDDIN